MFKLLKERLAGWRMKADTAPAEMFSDSGGRINEGKLEEVLYDLEMALLESDVALSVAKEIVDAFAENIKGKRITKKLDFDAAVREGLKQAVEKALSADRIDFFDFIAKSPKPAVVMFVGVNGTGKTTVIAKLAHALQERGLSCVIAAADTFRAGAIEQLEQHGEKLGVKVIAHKAGSDPAAVAYDAIEHAKARHRDVVLIDTAGRMQTNLNLMEQMKKIRRVASPNMTVFVGDALAGNDVVEQAKKFQETVGFDAAILAKIDADAKGGAALSIAHTVGKPILFVGTGQGYDDLQAFDARWLVDRLFGEAP
jgi:fused signal recognition particle receptor